MKIKTKFTLISLAFSLIPIITTLVICKDTSLIQNEDFQRVIVIAFAVAVVLGFLSPHLSLSWILWNQLKRVKALCYDIRHGNYNAFLNLPNEPSEKEEENELTSLMRDMNWMVNQIQIRETQLKDMIMEVETAKDAMNKSEMHYRHLIENMGDILFTLDLKGIFTFISSQAEVSLGHKPESMVNNDMKGYLAEESRSIFERNLGEQIQGKSISPYKVEFLSSNGQHIPFEINLSPLFNIEGELIGIEGIGRDMSEHERLEAELFQAQKMEVVGTLAGGVAHDFNNILQAISGFTEILLFSKTENDPDYKRLTQIEKQVTRASQLVRQLLAFSRRSKSKLQAIDLNKELKKTKEVLIRTLPRMINIEFHLDNELKPIAADPNQIEQIITNLAVNARDAMPDGGKLILKTENVILDGEKYPEHPAGKYILLSVSDTGVGMDRQTLEHIFEPFYTTKETGKGTGLGLAMVYGIVKNHNGFIRCFSKPERGTSFKIYLPVLETEDRNRDEEERKEEEIIGGDETILLVDDEEAILELGKEILEQYDYTVITAISGEEAIEIISKESTSTPDLVILDLNMPGIGGYKCLQELLKIDSRINVLVASGYSAEFEEKKIRETGARGFISKPYHMKQILKTVREVLDGVPSANFNNSRCHSHEDRLQDRRSGN